MASTLCLKYTGVIGKQKQQQIKDYNNSPGDSPLDCIEFCFAHVEQIY